MCRAMGHEEKQRKMPHDGIFFCKKFCQVTKKSYLCTRNSKDAEIAQLVEHNLAKVGVASSSLVFRSLTSVERARESTSLTCRHRPTWRNGRRARFRCEC